MTKAPRKTKNSPKSKIQVESDSSSTSSDQHQPPLLSDCSTTSENFTTSENTTSDSSSTSNLSNSSSTSTPIRDLATGVKSTPGYKVAGLFAGVGGIEMGFEEGGFEAVWSNEFDRKAAQTFSLNHQHQLVVDDIHNITPEQIPDVDVMVGGFPCQAFSIAGYRKGFEDKRGEVFFQMARLIKHKRPRVVFIENVKNLVSHDNGNTFKVIKQTLESLGYKVRSQVLNASDYGNIPQNRERIYVIGFLNKEDYENFTWIEPVTLTRKLGDVIDFEAKVDDKYYYTPEKYSIYDQLVEQITRQDTVYQWRRRYVRENKSNLCPTLTANMGTGGHNVPLILTKHGIRKLTPLECFHLQGYPQDFRLPPTIKGDAALYKQAGNSVVVPVIKRLADAIMQALQKTDSASNQKATKKKSKKE